MSKGLLVVGAMTAYFAGCGGSSVRRGAPNDDTQGHGGTVGGGASGGATGVGAGRNGGTGAQGGGTVGVGGGSTRGGRGGGPHLDGGTSGTAGSAGGAGTAGSGGAPDPDPSCDCTLDGRSFSCSSSVVSVPSVFAVPEQCAGLDTRVKRLYCDDGSTHYTFIEGEENAYYLEVDAEGHAIYFRASGYVSPGCGLDSSDFDEGTLTLGHPADSGCFESCALCQEYEGLPACPVCERDPNDRETVRQPLEDYCSENFCPATVTEAREHFASSCGTYATGKIRTACGVVTVSYETGFSLVEYVFEESSGEFDGGLVGVIAQDDVSFGACRATTYRAGDIPSGNTCPDASTCTFCAPETGEGGAAGAAGVGAGGDGSGTACPP